MSKQCEQSCLFPFYRDNNSLTMLSISSNMKILEGAPTPSKQVKEFDFILMVSMNNPYDNNVMQYAFTQHP